MTLAKISGPRLDIEIVPSTISETNSAPANGALYAEAMPAAAPHATSSLSRGREIHVRRPIHDAAVVASCAIAPSRPIEPPEETVNRLEIERTRLGATW